MFTFAGMDVKMFLTLLRKEIVLEFRQRYAISGIVLYVFSMIFVVYVASIRVLPPVWNILFWLIVLFASINAVVKSFVQESGARQLYYYQIADPSMLLLAKIVYNTLLLFVLSGLAYGAYSVVAGNPVKDPGLFWLVLVLGSLGFSIAFTFIASIAARANNSATLMAILSFPVVIPILLLLVNLSAHSIGILGSTDIADKTMLLGAVDLILVAMGLVLFPFLWRD